MCIEQLARHVLVSASGVGLLTRLLLRQEHEQVVHADAHLGAQEPHRSSCIYCLPVDVPCVGAAALQGADYLKVAFARRAS